MNDDKLYPVTVVIPVYNRAGMLEKTLDSVAAQTYRPLRLIVVDNNSTDASLAVARSWADSHQTEDFRVDVVTETHPGAAAARNLGLAMVESEWTMFFDSDDLMHPGHIALAMDTVRSHPGVELVGWDVAYHDFDDRVLVKPFEPDDIAYHNLMHGSLATQRYFARTELFRRAGTWNTDVGLWDDIELGVRLLKLNPSIVKRSGKPTVDVIQNAESITSTSYTDTLESCLNTLAYIRQNYPVASHVSLKQAILLGDCRLEGYAGADKLFADLLSKLTSRRERVVMRMAYYGRRMHLRGIARILRPFIKSVPQNPNEALTR